MNLLTTLVVYPAHDFFLFIPYFQKFCNKYNKQPLLATMRKLIQLKSLFEHCMTCPWPIIHIIHFIIFIFTSACVQMSSPCLKCQLSLITCSLVHSPPPHPYITKQQKDEELNWSTRGLLHSTQFLALYMMPF